MRCLFWGWGRLGIPKDVYVAIFKQIQWHHQYIIIYHSVYIYIYQDIWLYMYYMAFLFSVGSFCRRRSWSRNLCASCITTSSTDPAQVGMQNLPARHVELLQRCWDAESDDWSDCYHQCWIIRDCKGNAFHHMYILYIILYIYMCVCIFCFFFHWALYKRTQSCWDLTCPAESSHTLT